jgi:uncharacterized protein YcsI (UPF0317 family)
MESSLSQLSSLSPGELRALCRDGQFTGPTAGLARGYVQANLILLPQEYAFDFLLFCQRNPKPCPLVEVLEPGCFEPACAPGADLRSDLPGYRIYHKGCLPEESTDVRKICDASMTGFLLGCSFSFEHALMEAGIPLRHVEQGRNVAMYTTTIPCQPAGRLHGNMVVSMRPVDAAQAALAVEVSARFPKVHGAPVHIGAPERIGVTDLAQPDFGEAVDVLPGELPLFWACGVTPQQVLQASGIPFFISHAPGKMFITDMCNV